MRVCETMGIFSVGFGPGLDSMSPTRSSRSASHAKKTGWLGLRRGGVVGNNLPSPPDCGTPTTSRMYPFGAKWCHHHHDRVIKLGFSIFSCFSCFSLLYR